MTAPAPPKLYDRLLPALKAGPHRIKATQRITLTGGPEPQPERQVEGALDFHVAGPRFFITPADIHSHHPPPDGDGDYRKGLAHLVLRRPTLPWERSAGAGAAVEAPWLALLLFTEEEWRQVKEEPRPVASFTAGSAEIAGPVLPAEPGDRDTDLCQTLVLPRDLFRQVAPTEAMLPYLAHVREVDRRSKEDLPNQSGDMFSVVIGHRPILAAGRHIVALVSLEGMLGHLPDAPAQAVAPTTVPSRIRLVQLAKWAFTASERTLDTLFKELTGNDRFWLRAYGEGLAPAIEAALARGSVPLPHHARTGNDTVSWYRGPLVPVKEPESAFKQTWRNADELLLYDPDTGLFDASYAAAWQLGQLLALQSPDYVASLYQWRESATAGSLRSHAEALFNTAYPSAPLDPAEAQRILADDLLMTVILEYTDPTAAPVPLAE